MECLSLRPLPKNIALSLKRCLLTNNQDTNMVQETLIKLVTRDSEEQGIYLWLEM